MIQPPPSKVLTRALNGRIIAPGGGHFIDCVQTADGLVRLFCGPGTGAATFAAGVRPGFAQIDAASDIAHAGMIRLRGPGPALLAGGTGLPLDPARAEPELFAGRTVLLGSRIAETPRQVAQWLTYHARHHGAEAALILDRTANDAGFAAALDELTRDLALRIVVLRSPLPLGRADGIAQSDLQSAADAPGLARMTRPAPDPWLSDLAQPLIWEALKWRFLSQARAVLLLDCCDILEHAGPNAFALCTSARGGVISLHGRRSYPWRVKQGQEASFGDHICRQFDTSRGLSRWGVAPGKAGLDRVWRMIRVAETGASAPVLPFWRAMALRVPGQPTSRLVPKSSLIEDEGLIALAMGPLGHAPVRAPKTEIRDQGSKAPHEMRTAAVICMKNEGPFLLEWIAYHRVIGVTDFLVYTNDCTDGTDAFLDLLQEKGLVQHRANPWVPGGAQSPQYVALAAAESEAVVRGADWAIGMDADEFINVKIGDGTLGALYTAMGDANLISITWRLFGDSGVTAYEDRPIIGQFDRCAPEVIRKPHQAWGFKTLFKNINIFQKFGIHRPKGLQPEHWQQIRWLNGSGKPMPASVLRNGWRSTIKTYGYDWVQLNHYAVRSAQTFLVKRDRGRANHTARDLGRNYWFRMSHNADQDRSILRMLPALEAEMARLLADPQIRAAHDLCTLRHRARIAELMQRPDQTALYDELTGERMRRLTRMQANFGAAVFALGPQVIPDAVAFDDNLPADYIFTVESDGQTNH